MIKLAIIGTNWITKQFVEAALATEQYQLFAVYSRQLEQAKRFGSPFNAARYYDDLEQLASDAQIDAVYIASPNVLHAEQAIQMMAAGKHVICEKPIASHYQLAQKMFQVAEQNKVVLFEAFTAAYTPNFQVVKQHLESISPVRNALISYCQYSSRYQKYLDGDNPNTFNPQFSNGSIMDIGFYCIASAVELFGEPKSVQASAQLLASGVDGAGSVILSYDGFIVTVLHSKISQSFLPSEIQGENGSLLIPMISVGLGVEKKTLDGKVEDLTVQQVDNHMFYEAQAFAKQVAQGKMDSNATQRSLTVAKVITEVRRQTGVIFPADTDMDIEF
ncbi:MULTISPECIES: Gfo/Idh/MocA family protein [unclassified Vibrio]|uniref:Gfo/Idh/MocA family oxidoreductase n=1 Tax=Vibrio sp. HB236076 TaxID=3232307 RepID=A0AB39HK72_9VIBR|nr:Gfo/Idh/MocA family oxidoreductase [Vibrio sp. HB161653]MDP5253248.1 Gfo/Idh/MocA family oxidoreductase [Vibrio sp. HB161653]